MSDRSNRLITGTLASDLSGQAKTPFPCLDISAEQHLSSSSSSSFYLPSIMACFPRKFPALTLLTPTTTQERNSGISTGCHNETKLYFGSLPPLRIKHAIPIKNANAFFFINTLIKFASWRNLFNANLWKIPFHFYYSFLYAKCRLSECSSN